MGRPKLLLPWGDRTVVEATIAAWRASQVSRIVVTVHAEDVELREVVARSGADVVACDPPPRDMKESVSFGLRFVAEHYHPQTDDAWLLAPADLPTVSVAVIDRLLAAHLLEHPQILVAAHQGRRGHPVLLPWPLADHVQRLAVDEGINRLLQLHPTGLIECGPAALAADLDTPEDYQRLRGSMP
jgi:molybdenum cofactor cytidylyltransferase